MSEALIEEFREICRPRNEKVVDENKVPQETVHQTLKKPKQVPSSIPSGSKVRRRRYRGEWSLEDEQRLVKRWGEVRSEVGGTRLQVAGVLAPEFGKTPMTLYHKHWEIVTNYARVR